jgi:hypothetical protein
MPESKRSTEAEQLVKELQQGGLAFNRKETVEKIGKLSASSEAVVAALIQAREFDENEAVRTAAAEAIQAPAHQAVLTSDPDLERRASIPPKSKFGTSWFGILSYALAMISVIIVYLNIFVVGPNISGAVNPLGLGVGPDVVNSVMLLAGSFLLPLAGLILGIISLMRYGRKNVMGLIGLVGNALILFFTTYSVVSKQ